MSALAARTADPAFFLARAWQLGEFAAANGGSIVDAEIVCRTARIDSATSDGTKLASGGLASPLEALVERERLPRDWRQRIRIGQAFARRSRTSLAPSGETVIAILAIVCPVTIPIGDELVDTDDETLRFRVLMAGRAIDGEALLNLSDTDLGTAFQTAGLTVTLAAIRQVIEGVRGWDSQIYGQPAGASPAAWRKNRLDYEVEVGASLSAIEADGSIALVAPSYRNGDLDWPTFSCPADATLPAWAGDEPDPVLIRPTRVGFAGMPHSRFWAFEDYRVDFGALDVAKPDIAKLALVEFALVFGDDWFLVPITVPLGSVATVTRLCVFDTFGQSHEVSRAVSEDDDESHRFELFAPHDPRATSASGAPLLVVPPVLSHKEESPAVEEVRFLRDEGANLVWAVEHTVRSQLGDGVDGFRAHGARTARQRARDGTANTTPTTPAPLTTTTPLAYRLATSVPANWIPFLPAEAHQILGDNGPGRPSIALCRAQMLRDGSAVPVPALTHILDTQGTDALLWLDEEAVPREGIRVILTRQRARWIDGTTHVWFGRKVLVGKGEGRSGLRFDEVTSP